MYKKVNDDDSYFLFFALPVFFKPGFYQTKKNATTTTQEQSDYEVEQLSLALIALFSLENDRCLGRNWPIGNQVLLSTVITFENKDKWSCDESMSVTFYEHSAVQGSDAQIFAPVIL